MSQRGFALLIVLLVMGFLSLLGTRMVAAGRVETRLAGNLRMAAMLDAAADGAIAHAVFSLEAAHDPSFAMGASRELTISGISVLVAIQNEADRINLNTASIPLLQALMVALSVPPVQAAGLAAAIVDWHMATDTPRPNGAKAPQYRAAGLGYGPPGTPFRDVAEIRNVLGVTQDLFARMAPHVTVWTDSDPDMSTRDPVVARALADASGVADDAGQALPGGTDVLRITASARGPDGGRTTIAAVVTGDFQSGAPAVKVLWRAHCAAGDATVITTSCF